MSVDRSSEVLAAAYRCFCRHGLRRTTMDDIAAEAGMSRPSAYQYVKNKEDAFRRLATQMFDAALDAAREAAAPRAGHDMTARAQAAMATKLELTLRLWRDSPAHAAEMLDESGRLTGDLVERYTAAVTDVLAGVFGSSVTAELAVALTRGLEANLTDHDVTRARMRRGIALLVAGLHAAPPEAPDAG